MNLSAKILPVIILRGTYPKKFSKKSKKDHIAKKLFRYSINFVLITSLDIWDKECKILTKDLTRRNQKISQTIMHNDSDENFSRSHAWKSW